MERAIAFVTSLFTASTLTKKASLNSLAAGVEYSARFVVAFFVTPFLIGGLGDVLYGVWVVILKMTDYVSAGGRSSQALKWFVVNRQESSDVAEKRHGVGGAIASWLIFLPLQATLGCIVAWYVPVWLNVSPELFWTVRTATFIVVSSLVLGGCVDVPQSVLIGENLGYKRIWISAPLVATGGGLTIGALHLGFGIIGVASAMLTTIVLTGLIYIVVAKRNVPWFGFSMPTLAIMRQFVGWSWWFTLWDLIVRAMMVSDVVLLGILTSPEMVAVYAVVRFLPEGVLRFLTVLVYETIPGIGKILAGGDHQRAASARGEVMVMTWLATTSVGATILLWNNSFVKLWVGPEYAVDALPMLLIMVMVFQFVWIRADADFINLTLNLKRKVALGAFSTVLSLALGVLLIRLSENGIIGVCLGFICGRAILSVGYPVILGRFFKVPFQSHLAGFIRPGTVTIGLFVLAAKLSIGLDVNDWLSFCSLAAVTGCLMFIVAFLGGLSVPQRNVVLMRLRMLTRRVGG